MIGSWKPTTGNITEQWKGYRPDILDALVSMEGAIRRQEEAEEEVMRIRIYGRRIKLIRSI